MLVPATPLRYTDVLAARDALRPYLDTTPARHYAALDADVGHGVRVVVKHENHLPVCTFKVRNGTAALLSLPPAARARGVIAASTGNHGQGLAWAGSRLGVAVTICVPVGNNPEKNASIRALGAELIEVGATYDECVAASITMAERDGRTLVHSTNHAGVLAGAATMAEEFLEQVPELDAMILSLGGGSQTVGALTVRAGVKPGLEVFAAQSAGAPAQHDAWRDGRPRTNERVDTFAEGIACGSTYDFTFASLRAGLDGFLLVNEAEIADAVRTLYRITHNVAEGAGATGYAALKRHGARFAGKTVGVVISGGNLDSETLRRILAREM